MSAGRTISIVPYLEFAARRDPSVRLEEIFFEASATKSFADAVERADFLERWLGRYLTHFPEHAYLAVAGEDNVVGYVVGAMDDPAGEPLFADIAYFRTFAHLTAAYPAHLHINVHAQHRSGGIGARLIETFSAKARQSGATGVHVVTAWNSRNISFYSRQGFVERGRQVSEGIGNVFLARNLVSERPRDI